jgi:hypothetical protein
VNGDDLTAASGTLPWNKLADWMQRLADIALNIATTAWTFTQAIVMQSTLAVTGAITGASISVTGAVTGASATLSGALSSATATFSGLLTGAAATFSGLLTANGGIAHATPLVVGGTGVAFQNSYTAAAQAPRYWKDPVGVVHLDGGVTRASSLSAGVAFTLPGAHSPTVKQELVGWNVTTSASCDVVVETNGDVKITISAGGSVFLPGLTFPTF